MSRFAYEESLKKWEFYHPLNTILYKLNETAKIDADNAAWLTCDFCSERDKVEYREHPYWLEHYDRLYIHPMCENCYEEKIQDI